jgi:hypothetical protein
VITTCDVPPVKKFLFLVWCQKYPIYKGFRQSASPPVPIIREPSDCRTGAEAAPLTLAASCLWENRLAQRFPMKCNKQAENGIVERAPLGRNSFFF